MRQNIIYLICAPALVLFGCKEFQVPDPEGPEAPIFYAEGALDGADFRFQADGETFDAFSTYSTDSLGVYSYTGELRSIGCEGTNCGPRLEVRVRGSEDIDADLQPEPYAFRSMHDADERRTRLYTVTVTPEVVGDVLSCDWLINGSKMITTDGNAPLVILRTSDEPTFFRLQLTAHFSGGCESVIEDMVYLPSHGCSTEVSVSLLDSAQHLLYKAVPEGQEAYEYAWTFDNGVMASTLEVEYKYTSVPASGADQAKLIITSTECTAQRVHNQIIDPSLVNCLANFSYSVETELAPINADLHTVEIDYVDEQGVLYQSSLIDQPDWASFMVLGVVDYYDRVIDRDLRSKSTSADVSVLLKGPDGTIELRDARVVLPLGLGL